MSQEKKSSHFIFSSQDNAFSAISKQTAVYLYLDFLHQNIDHVSEKESEQEQEMYTLKPLGNQETMFGFHRSILDALGAVPGSLALIHLAAISKNCKTFCLSFPGLLL
jgi:hypothetical protein